MSIWAFVDFFSLLQTALKNADAMLRKIMTEVDTNGDGKIQYEGTYSTVPGVRKPPYTQLHPATATDPELFPLTC